MSRYAGLLIAFLLLGAHAGAGPAGPVTGEPAVGSVSPPSGTRGTELTITGSGFGHKKPRVLLVPEAGGKSRRLKVLEWSDDEIRARIRKALAGAHGLVVRPKGKGAGEAIAPTAFDVLPPTDLDTDAVCVLPADEVILTGTAFGKKKGKVIVGGRKAKILSWTFDPQGSVPDQVRFRVPPKKVMGAVDVELRTAVGATTLTDGLLVLDSTEDGFTATFEGVVFEAEVEGSATAVDVVGGQTHVFVADPAGDSVEFRVLWDPSVDGAAQLDGPEILQFSWQHAGKLWVLELDGELQSSISLQLDPHCEGAILGSFSGYLVERFGPGTVQVSAGQFQLPL